jgi:hypothetical protein
MRRRPCNVPGYLCIARSAKKIAICRESARCISGKNKYKEREREKEMERISLSAYIARVATHGNVIPFPNATLNSFMRSGIYSQSWRPRNYLNSRTREGQNEYPFRVTAVYAAVFQFMRINRDRKSQRERFRDGNLKRAAPLDT